MTSAYPGALDTLTNPGPTDPQTSPSHSGQHADANDAIEAIQATLGIDPHGALADVAARLDAIEAALGGGGGGLALMVPTSVAGSGVSLTGGKVVFAAATSVSVNGCFTSAYDLYRIMVYVPSGSSVTTASIRMRVSGADASGANYNFVLDEVTTTNNPGRTTGQTSAYLSYLGDSGSFFVVEIAAPALAAPTLWVAKGLRRGDTTSVSGIDTAGGHSLSTAYDGFTVILNNAGTGTIRVFGYQSS